MKGWEFGARNSREEGATRNTDVFKDDIIVNALIFIQKFCEEEVRISAKEGSSQLSLTGITRDRVALAKFIYKLPFHMTKNLVYIIEEDVYIADPYIFISRDNIESNFPLVRDESNYEINLSDVDRELKIRFKVVPKQLLKILRRFKDLSHSIRVVVRDYKVYLEFNDRITVDASSIIRPMKKVDLTVSYPLKWFLKSFMVFPTGSYVEMITNKERPIKISFINSPRKKLFVYIAPLVED